MHSTLISFSTHARLRAAQTWLGLLGLLAVATSAQAQTAATYQLATSIATFTPLVGGTAVPTVLRDDAVSGSLPIGFSFVFGGVNYTSFQASSNGLLGLGGSLSDAGGSLSNSLSTSVLAGGSLPAFAPFWTDLGGYAGTGAAAQYATSGTAPNRVLTMEWLDFKDLNGDAEKYISFQVKLYETTGRIEYCYRKGLTGEAGDATIGLKAADGSFLSLNMLGSSPTVSSTISYNRLNRPATGQVYAFAPVTTPLTTAATTAAADVKLYPNPVQGAFTVVMPAVAGATAVWAELFDSLGQTVHHLTAALPAAGARFTVATASLPAGIYTLRLQAGTATLVKRVVVQ